MSNPAKTLRTLRQLGITRLRVGLYWSHVAPSGRRKPSHFNASNAT